MARLQVLDACTEHLPDCLYNKCSFVSELDIVPCATHLVLPKRSPVPRIHDFNIATIEGNVYRSSNRSHNSGERTTPCSGLRDMFKLS